MKPGWLIALGFAGGIAVCAVGLRLRSVTADVPPPAERMFYAGELREGAGPATGPRDIEIRFHSTATGSGNQICTSGLQANTPLVDGHFRINVGSACVTALAAAQNAYVEVVVGVVSLPPSTTPRPRLAAVPYAAQSATAATLTSPLPATAVTTATGPTVEARFTDIEARFERLANPHICGFTAPTTGRLANADGYRAGALLCRAVAGCSATTATICSSTDVVRFLGNNGAAMLPAITGGDAWIATGHFGAARGNSTVFENDCNNFTNEVNSGPYVGNRVGIDGMFSDADCSSQRPVLCCDH
ncbi:MAG: hypothetical protein IPH80_33810 [Myxococcales bacterium]|nr:hypothetical protein [Myxococcales bacterium]